MVWASYTVSALYQNKGRHAKKKWNEYPHFTELETEALKG